jgi:monoamine oxidase
MCGSFISYDDTSHDEKKFAIVGFIAGKAAAEWAARSLADRKAAVLQNYARWWGPRALQPTVYLEKYWKDEEFAQGCYLGVCPPGVFTAAAGALQQPCGRVFWAGTEASPRWYGYMEGALESAAIAVDRLLPALVASSAAKL